MDTDCARETDYPTRGRIFMLYSNACKGRRLLLAVSNGKYMKNSLTVKNLWPIVIAFLAITGWGADGFPVLRWTEVDDNIIAPIWSGNDDKGYLITPLYRGAFPGIEDSVYTPPGRDCSRLRATLRSDWDSSANTVHYPVKGRNFQVRPSVLRTAGVDYFFDPFHQAPKDITNGAYRLWAVLGSTTRKGDFYYD